MSNELAVGILKRELVQLEKIFKMYEGHPEPVMHVMNLFYPNIQDDFNSLKDSISKLESGEESSNLEDNFVVIEQHVLHKEHVRVLYSGANEEKAKEVFTSKVEKDESESWKVWVEHWKNGAFSGTIEVY
jgi:hypothetical protein